MLEDVVVLVVIVAVVVVLVLGIGAVVVDETASLVVCKAVVTAADDEDF